MLIWTNFDSFAIKRQYKWIASKISFSSRGCAKFFANTKGPGTSFQAAVFVDFFDEIISFGI